MKACEDIDIERECHVIIDAETAMTQLRVKEQEVCRPPSEASKGQEGFFPTGNMEGVSTVVLDFQPLEL